LLSMILASVIRKAWCWVPASCSNPSLSKYGPHMRAFPFQENVMAAKNKAVEPEETVAQDNHATVVAQAERKSVVFLGPHHRYSRGDIACFEGTRAEELVNRRIAVWPEDAERALKPKPGDSDFDTDIG
ncbi:hypothetical protein ACRE80_27440, partial [Klebsiella pneumoniae]